MIFVYRGEESTGADGIKKECIHQVMDRSRPVKFQIDGLEGESFEINHTIKFVGNIPLKPLSMADIPEELSSQRVEICR
jgi:hypothetical protein